MKSTWATTRSAPPSAPRRPQKTVAVKKYVLPKFKTEVKADKNFYLPKETIHADHPERLLLRQAGRRREGRRSTPAPSTWHFKDFHTIDTQDRRQRPCQVRSQAAGLLRRPAAAEGQRHREARSQGHRHRRPHRDDQQDVYPVSDQPIRVSLIPEGGRLVPGMDNRIFAAAIYPDGSPAQVPGQAVARAARRRASRRPRCKTNEAGLAEFTVNAEAEAVPPGRVGRSTRSKCSAARPAGPGGRSLLLDLTAEAKDDKGNIARDRQSTSTPTRSARTSCCVSTRRSIKAATP